MSVLNHFKRWEFYLRTQGLCGEYHPEETKHFLMPIQSSDETT